MCMIYRLGLAACLASLALLWPTDLRAFCGFYVSSATSSPSNTASQAVLLRKDNHTVLSISNNYAGPPEDFAMVVPVPAVLNAQQVKTLSTDVFRRLEQLSAPKLVEYWERDPCDERPSYGTYRQKTIYDFSDDSVEGDLVRPTDQLGVKIEARFTVDEYQILVLSAKESVGLETWLLLNHYKLPAGSAAALAPYIREQMKFVVAKVDIKKVHRDAHGLVVLSPLRFSYDANDLRLPVRLGLLNTQGKQDLVVYILHPDKRFEVANYPNLFIPTNLEVTDAVRNNFGGFYAELFDATLRLQDGRAVITEYAWSHRLTSSQFVKACDPCPPGDQFTAEDLFTLGADQIAGIPTRDVNVQFVLTRLHTRYEPAKLAADLIFRSAADVRGGLTTSRGQSLDQGYGSDEDVGNKFQGRYILRHLFAGPILCPNPHYGRWDGFPTGLLSSDKSPAAIQTATDLANQLRGQLSLPSVVRSAVPSLKLKGLPRPLRKGEQP